MNNNMGFSKNVFGGGLSSNNAANNLTSYNQDGGRRSLNEVREAQLNAERKIHPDAGKEFQVNTNHGAINPSKMTGAFRVNTNSNESVRVDRQMNDVKTKVDALNNINRRGF